MAKKKQKKNWIGVVTLLCIGGGLGGVLGLWIVRFTELRGDEDFGAFLYIVVALLLWMYFSMFLHIILHEVGHLIAGLLSGYRFSSFRVGSFAWVKRDGKIRFCRYSLAGTAGQCLMAPPELQDGKIPVVLYNMGGVIVNILTALLCMVPALLLPSDSIGHALCIIASFTGFLLALLNGLPMRGVVNNDGSNALAVSRNPAAMRAFWVQMMVAERIAQGDRIKDMPEKWFDCPVWAPDNALIVAIWVYRTNLLMERQAFAQAEAAIDELLRADNLMGLYRAALTADKLFCMMLRGAYRGEIDALYYSKEQKQMMAAMRTNPSIIRTQYAYAVLVSGDAREAAKQQALFEKVAAKYPYPQEIESERELLALLPVRG